MQFNVFIRLFVGLAGLMILSTPSIAQQTSGALLSSAIKTANTISTSLPTTARLEAYREVLTTIERIQTKFPASEEAIQLLSGQAIGNFDPDLLLHAYVGELSSYYEMVCDASPNFECLAFVSLQQGSDGCRNATALEPLSKAHAQITNAIKIFITQQSDKTFVDLALRTYRNCASINTYQTSQWVQDYHYSKLVPTLVSLGKESTAKAFIESMDTPFFKFSGVIALKQDSSEAVPALYINRLDEYIETKLEGNDAFLANLELRKFAALHSTMPIEYRFAYDAVQKVRNYGPKRCFNEAYQDYVADSLFEYGNALIQLPKYRRKLTNEQILTLTNSLSLKPRDVLDSCVKEGEAKLSTKVESALLVSYYMGAEKGEAYWSKVKDETYSESALYDLFFSHIELTALEIIMSQYEWDHKERIDYQGRVFDMVNDSAATFPVFKQLVDSGDVCRSTKILFKELKGTPHFEQAIEYIVNSSSLDSSIVYECGDAELELLLN